VAALLCWQLAGGERSVVELIAIYSGGLFVACMVCHGELHRLRPPVTRHTAFYLMIAAGGALGGAFVALVAPRLFASDGELYAAICLIGLCLAFIHGRERTTIAAGGRRWPVWPMIGVATMARAAVTVSRSIASTTRSRMSASNSAANRVLAADRRLTAMIRPISGSPLMGSILPAPP
jgi:hypothetical protein